MPLLEIQARWSVGILTGQVTLPSPEAMLATSHKYQDSISDRTASIAVQQPRHTIYIDAIDYIDRLSAPLGANPTLGKLLKKLVTGNPIKGLGILSSVYLDVSSSGQWRLFGDGACVGLAEASIRRIGSGGKEMSAAEIFELEKLKDSWKAAGQNIKDHEDV
jgi:dimethylaniline monooxygenase (N-oxide forming)